jgi:ABC-type multidrug transport system fused ATPase/permease subunit
VDVNSIRFLYRELQGYRHVLLLSMGMAVGLVLCDLLTAFPLKFILDKVINHSDPGWPWIVGVGPFDQLGTREGLRPTEMHTQLAVIAFSAAMILSLGVLRGVFTYVQLYSATLTGRNVGARLRTTAFEHVLRLSLDWHGKRKTGDLVQRLTGNVADIEKLIIDGLVDLLAGLLTIVGMLAVMLAFNWQFTLLSVFIVPTLSRIVWRYTRWIKKATKEAAHAAGQVADVATEDIRAISEVKAFTLEEREAKHFAGYVDRYRTSALRAGRLQAQFTPMVAFVLAISTFTIVLVGSYVATGHDLDVWFLTLPAGSLTIGTLTLFLAYVKQLYQPLKDLSKLMYVATNAVSGAERIQELQETPPEVFDIPGVLPVRTRLRGSLDYHNVTFGYLPERPVIKDLNLHIETGQKVALVGLSGSGKTTLVRLIPRFYEPWQGSVQVDGADNRSYPLRLLRRNISFVLQDSVLFEGTIRDNIAIGRPEATDQEVVQAARKAQIHDTIKSMPDGYESHVREQGKNFSSGQRQRLAIARAVLRDAPILILDEPTASLDVEAEAEVMNAIDRMINGRTVIMISHRLSTLGHVDWIAVLDDGRLVEQGDFAALRSAGGIFARLFEEQYRYSPEQGVAEGSQLGRNHLGLVELEPPAAAGAELGGRGWPRSVP